MFRRVFLSALVAGVLGGLILSAVQTATTTPLILHAEVFEKATSPPAAATARAQPSHDHAGQPQSAGHDRGEGWAPADGAERLFYTATTNVLAGFGFALLIVGGFALSGRKVDARSGVLWGIGGFTVFTLAPVLGLPPELPGTAAAELAARQGWWGLTVAATAVGLLLIVFRGSAVAAALGLCAIALPHLIGAPHPHELTNAVPPELAAQFAAGSVATSAVFWVLLGWISGKCYERLHITETAGAAAASPP